MRNARTSAHRALALLCSLLAVQTSHAATFNGGDIQSGLGLASAIRTGGSGSVRATLLSMLYEVLLYVGLAAVVVLVIAGIILVVAGGSDEWRDRAKKIIIYTIIGLFVLILASVFVGLIISIGTA